MLPLHSVKEKSIHWFDKKSRILKGDQITALGFPIDMAKEELRTELHKFF